MSRKILGFEFKEFMKSEDERYFPGVNTGDCMVDIEIKIDGNVIYDIDVNDDSHLIVEGIIYNDLDCNGQKNFMTVFNKWKKDQNTKKVSVIIPLKNIENVELLFSQLRELGCKII